MSDSGASVELELPVRQAWRAVTAWSEQGQWMPMTRVEVLSGDGGLGTTLRARTGLGRLAVVDEMRIDVWEPPHRAEVEHFGRIVSGRGVFTVAELPGGRSRVSWFEQPSGLMARLGKFAAMPSSLVLHIALRRLRRVAASLG